MERKEINGLKGFACVMVMLGHFIGLYKYAEIFPNTIQEIEDFFSSKVSFVIDETFWVYLFFVVSGYLLAMSKIDSFKHLLIKCILRFLRLGLPIIFAYFIIYIIFTIIGFHTSDTIELITNTWIQKVYQEQYSVKDVLFAPIDVLFIGNVGLNGPYWVLKDMFIASVVIYLMSYIRKHFIFINRVIITIMCLIGFVVSFIISKIVFACYIGMLLCWLENNYKSIINTSWFRFFSIICLMSLYVIPRTYVSLLFFSALIVFIPRISFLNKIFTSKIAMFFGKISFGIYSFHWPIYCSIGMIVFCLVAENFGLFEALVATIICSFLITVLLSQIYNIIIERPVSRLLNMISIKLCSLCK